MGQKWLNGRWCATTSDNASKSRPRTNERENGARKRIKRTRILIEQSIENKNF